MTNNISSLETALGILQAEYKLAEGNEKQRVAFRLKYAIGWLENSISLLKGEVVGTIQSDLKMITDPYLLPPQKATASNKEKIASYLKKTH